MIIHPVASQLVMSWAHIRMVKLYTESGQYTNTYTNVSGCDSTHTLNLTINYTTYGTDTQEHCDTFTC